MANAGGCNSVADGPEPGHPQRLMGLLERLPADVLRRHVWARLPRRDRKRVRETCRGVAHHVADDIITHLQVLVCRSSLLQLTTSGTTLHARFPRPASLTLRLLPPLRGQDTATAGAVPTGSSDSSDGWHGSTAVLSYFLSELGVATSVTSLSLQGWQELSPRDLHHVSAAYPRLARLALAGLPGSNFLAGGALGALGRGPARAALAELAVEAQVVMDTQAALESLALLPHLVSLQLSALPLLPSAPALPLGACLGGLTRLVLTLEHRHPGVEAQLAGLAQLTRLRHLGLDFMQLGTGSSLWSAGWLLSSVLRGLGALTALHLPRAFLDAAAQPECLGALASLTDLSDLALGSLILDGQSAARAMAGTAATRGVEEAAAGPGAGAGAGAHTACDQRGAALRAPPCPGAAAGAATLLARPWRRLALGAAMPCYLEILLQLMGLSDGGGGGGGSGGDGTLEATAAEARGASDDGEAAPVAALTPGQAAPELGSPPSMATPFRGLTLRSPSSPRCAEQPLASTGTPLGSRGGAAGGCVSCGGAGVRRGGSQRGGEVGRLGLLELSSPCTLQLVQLLPQFLARSRCAGGAGCGGFHTPAALSCSRCCDGAAGGCGGSAGAREVSLLLRLAANWREVVGALAALGPALRGLALLPTYLYGSGTMLSREVVSAVAAALPGLAHLELHRLDTDPRDVEVLAGMPGLRFVFLGIAEEACERRGSGHPAATVRALLSALHASRAGGGSGRAGLRELSSEAASLAQSRFDGCEQLQGSAGVACGVAGREVVVCCPELTDAETERLDEMCETAYGMYDAYGGRLRVRQARERTLASRLSVAVRGPGRVA